MADDKPTLTRRRVLGGMATIGAAGALGAGAWAGYSDSETAAFDVDAGNLDIVLYKSAEDGSSIGPFNGEPVPITVENIHPGETVERVIRAGNRGTVLAKALSVDIENVETSEGESPESETDKRTSNGGELEDQLEIQVNFDDGFGDNAQLIGDLNGTSPDTFVDFETAVAHGPYTANNVSLDPTTNGYRNLYVQLRYEDLDPSDNNKSQGDTVSFDLDATFYQNNQ